MAVVLMAQARVARDDHPDRGVNRTLPDRRHEARFAIAPLSPSGVTLFKHQVRVLNLIEALSVEGAPPTKGRSARGPADRQLGGHALPADRDVRGAGAYRLAVSNRCCRAPLFPPPRARRRVPPHHALCEHATQACNSRSGGSAIMATIPARSYRLVFIHRMLGWLAE